jgi:hypothetical protein
MRGGIEIGTGTEIATLPTALSPGAESLQMKISHPRAGLAVRVVFRTIICHVPMMGSAAPAAMPISAGSVTGMAETTTDLVTTNTETETETESGSGSVKGIENGRFVSTRPGCRVRARA